MSEYIVSGEYASYGLPSGGTTQQNVKAASALIDGYVMRPEGLVWSPDISGQPCFMAGAAAKRTWAIEADIEPGTSVSVALDSVPLASILGETLVLDAPTPSSCEAAVVTALSGSTVTFDSIVRVHSATSPATLGLVISERRNVGYQGPVAFLSRSPIARLLAVGTTWERSSIREPSLSDNRRGLVGDYAEGVGPVPNFGSTVPQWNLLDPTLLDCDIDTGKLLVRIFGPRNEVKVNYLAGWTQPTLPDIIKRACASLVLAIQGQDPATAGAKLYKAGDTAIQRFNNSLFDDDMKLQLDEFRAKPGL